MLTVWVQIPPWTQSGLAVSGQNKTAHAFGRNWVWASRHAAAFGMRRTWVRTPPPERSVPNLMQRCCVQIIYPFRERSHSPGERGLQWREPGNSPGARLWWFVRRGH